MSALGLPTSYSPGSIRFPWVLQVGVNLQVLTLILGITLFCAPFPASAAEQHDVRIVVDISGSMKKSDPKLLRRPAVNLVAQMLPEGAKAGVWTFGRFVNMLVPLSSVDAQWRSRAQAQSQLINSMGLYTNIPDALERAMAGWQTPDENTRRSVILLTDGKVDIAKDPVVNAKARQDVLSRLIPRLRQTGANVHTIALSEDVDVELLQALSFQTDGQFQVANSEDDLLRVFVSAFDASVPQQQVPLGNDNGFVIDKSVEEFTVLVYKKAGAQAAQLVTPGGNVLDARSHDTQTRWFVDSALEVVTVSAPEPGAWQLVADIDPGNRVTVLSDLTLVLTPTPSHVVVGQDLPMDIYFKDNKGVVRQREFFSLLDLAFKQHFLDANQIWEGQLSTYTKGQVNIPEDGHYHARLSKSLLPGEHEITVTAQGRTFERRVVRKFVVISDFITANVEPPATPNGAFTLRVTPIEAYVDTSLTITAQVQAPDNTTRPLALVLDSQGARPSGWRAGFDAFGGPGVYRVMVMAKGQSLAGSVVQSEVGPLEAATSDFDVLGTRAASRDFNREPLSATVDAVDSFDVQVSGDHSADKPLDEAPEEPLDEALEEEELQAPIPEDETQDLGVMGGNLKWLLLGTFMALNAIVMLVGFIFYRRASKRKAQEYAEEDARLAALAAAGESQTSDNAHGREGLPEQMPAPPDMEEDEDEPGFDPDRIG